MIAKPIKTLELHYPMIKFFYNSSYASQPPLFIANYNIVRVLALYKSYWTAMNKIFIYARPCVNKDFFSCVFPLFSQVLSTKK